MHADVRTFAVQDETYFRDSYKGCRKGTMSRPARKSGRKAAKRGLSKQQVCVVTGIDDVGASFLVVFGRGMLGKERAYKVLNGRIGKGALVATDKVGAYPAVLDRLGKHILDYTHLAIFLHLSPVRIMTIMLGNGAGPPGTPSTSKRSLPLMNLISARLRIYCWNHLVSVLAGSSITTMVFFRLASILHLRTHSGIALPYGGLQNTVSPPHSWLNALFSAVKYFGHLWFVSLLAASNVKWNSRSSCANKSVGVSQFMRFDM